MNKMIEDKNDFPGSSSERLSLAVSNLKDAGIHLKLPQSLVEAISDEFLFDGDDLLFKSLAKQSRVYFEYGCGKSTSWVLRNSQAEVHSVDTSLEWVSRVKRDLSTQQISRLNLSWIDVGSLGKWGRPVDYSRRENFEKYTSHLWHSKPDTSPDLVLVDGRFRVASFFATLRYAGRGTKILFDDYFDRPIYHLVEEFVPVVDRCGRQALFEVTSNHVDPSLQSLQGLFSMVMD